MPPAAVVVGVGVLGPGGLGWLQGGAALVFAIAAMSFALSYGALACFLTIRRAGAWLPARELEMLRVMDE